MEPEEASNLAVGLLMGILGLLGLFLASAARDNEMYIFGLGLACWGAVFVLGLIRRHYDRIDAARGGVHGH